MLLSDNSYVIILPENCQQIEYQMIKTKMAINHTDTYNQMRRNSIF